MAITYPFWVLFGFTVIVLVRSIPMGNGSDSQGNSNTLNGSIFIPMKLPANSTTGKSASRPAVNETAAKIFRATMMKNWLRRLTNNGTDSPNNGAVDSLSADEDENSDNSLDTSLDTVAMETQMIEKDSPLLFEGDILGIDPNAIDSEIGQQFTASSDAIWPDGIVYYSIPQSVPGAVQPEFAKLVESKMLEIMKYTCIKFQKQVNEKDYIKIFAGITCNSYVGRQGNPQYIQYDEHGCRGDKQILHELLHALGVYHEMARVDRNDYIRILPENIKLDEKRKKDNFQVYKANVHGLPFDYDSVMMYQSHDFAKDPSKPTIEVIADPARPTGTSQKLTEMDIFTLNDLYSCSVSGCDDRDNGKVSFNNKCYYASSNIMSFSQAEEACKSNNGVVAYISADLLAAFFKTTNYPEADMIYWLATKSDVAHDNEIGSEDSDDDDRQCAAVIQRVIHLQSCEYYNNVICEIKVS